MTAILGVGTPHVGASRDHVASLHDRRVLTSFHIIAQHRGCSLQAVRDNDDALMDNDHGPYSGVKPPTGSATNGPDSVALNKTASPSTTNSRHSPVTPLAPLEFLQNQRRGSITDPSLHVAGGSGTFSLSSSSSANKPPSLRQPDPSTTLGRSSSVSPPRTSTNRVHVC
jgi:hypothetical protein